MTTSYIPPEIFRQEVGEIVTKLLTDYNKVSVALTEDFYPISRDSLQFLTKILKARSNMESTLFRLLGRTLINSESLSGGSGVISFVFAMCFLQELLRTESWKKNKNFVATEAFDAFMAKIKTQIETTSKIPTEADLENFCKQVCQDDTLAEVVMETLKMAGIDGRIYVEDSKQPNFTIERKTGYSFKAKPFKFFLNPATNVWEQKMPKVLLVDGLVDKVSEIDNILRGAMESQIPAIIVAREFSEEVIATLKVNFDKETFKIVPVKVNADLESINILNDIASVCNTEIVSTLKGEMLCFQKWDDLPFVETVRCLPDQLVIEESKSRAKVSSQLQHLLSKRQDEHIEDIVNLLDERIKSLTGDVINLRLPSSTDVENQATRAKIDVALRGAKTILNYNIVDLEDVVSRLHPETEFERCIVLALSNSKRILGSQINSSLSTFLGINLSGKQALMIISSAGVVLSDPVEQVSIQPG